MGIEEGQDTKFNVCLRNYASRPKDPAVLVIVATSNGTSAQVIESSRVQTLYYNMNGERASFIAKRLKDQRRERGEKIEGEMTSEEKADNMILIIQVPLKQKERRHLRSSFAVPMCTGMPMAGACKAMAAPRMLDTRMDECVAESCDVDQAIVSVGQAEGKFDELNYNKIERDERYPVRVTLQYYKATSNGVIDETVVEEIAVQMITARSFAEHNEIGSLVTGSDSKRPTEAVFTTPDWFLGFWRDNFHVFPDLSYNQADKIVFTGNTHLASLNVDKAKNEALRILQESTKPKPSRPLWDPSVPL